MKLGADGKVTVGWLHMSSTLKDKVALVTGAGSGIGRAICQRLAQEECLIVLVGRERSKLDETVARLPKTAKTLICDADISNNSQVVRIVGSVQHHFSRLDLLVNAAGVNVTQRSLADCSVEDFEKVIAIDLTGAFLITKAFIPMMREQKHATVINIGSDAGWRGNSYAGVAYISAKFGLRGLTEAINAEERHNGIRATSIYPGEVDTPILDKRPKPPSAEQRAVMLQPEDVAECVALAALMPPRAIVEDLVIRPAVRHWGTFS